MKKFLIIIFTLLINCKYYSQSIIDFHGKSNIITIGKHGYLEKDKLLHSTAGGFVGSSVYMYVHYKTDKKIFSLICSVASAFLVGTAKECYDKSIGHKFSNDDLLVTGFAGFTGGFIKTIQISVQEQNKLKELEKYQDLSVKMFLD